MNVKLWIINNYFTIVKKGCERMNSQTKKGLSIILLIIDCVLLFFCANSNIVAANYALNINQFILQIAGLLLLPCILGVLIALILSNYIHFSMLQNLKNKNYISNILLTVMIIHTILNIGIILVLAFALELPIYLYNYLNFAQNNILFITTMYFILGFIFIQSSTKKN